jgi:hypothetical protein
LQVLAPAGDRLHERHRLRDQRVAIFLPTHDATSIRLKFRQASAIIKREISGFGG